MIIKKFYGNSIEEAREQARGQLGEECVILESVNKSDGQPASVTAMSDGGAAAASAGNAPDASGKAGEESGEEAGNTYGRRDLIPSSLRNAVEDGLEAFSSPANGSGTAVDSSGGSRGADPSAAPEGKRRDSSPEVTMSRRSTPIHRNGKKGKGSFGGHLNERAVSQEVRALHRRFDHLESLMSDAMVSANLEYVSHPAYQQLLETGMRAPVVSRWFEQILAKGIDPYEQQQTFLYELARIVRGTLDVEAHGDPEKHLLFVGPAGGGKTSLIMKLASHPDFMGGRHTALVTVGAGSRKGHYSPLPRFAEDHSLPHFEAAEGVEISRLLPKLEEFDHVLYDTPPLSLNGSASFRDFWQIRQLLTPVTPLEIHFTVNATLERYYFKEGYAREHPLQPDYIAITRLDETDKWGRLLPFLQARDCGVRYVSNGPDAPDDLRRFSPSWFAEHILSHS